MTWSWLEIWQLYDFQIFTCKIARWECSHTNDNIYAIVLLINTHKACRISFCCAVLSYSYSHFFAHLAKGHVSFCHHLVGIIHKFYIFFYSSAADRPNETKLFPFSRISPWYFLTGSIYGSPLQVFLVSSGLDKKHGCHVW